MGKKKQTVACSASLERLRGEAANFDFVRNLTKRGKDGALGSNREKLDAVRVDRQDYGPKDMAAF